MEVDQIWKKSTDPSSVHKELSYGEKIAKIGPVYPEIFDKIRRTVTGQLADRPTRRQSSRGQAYSRTSQLAESSYNRPVQYKIVGLLAKFVALLVAIAAEAGTEE